MAQLGKESTCDAGDRFRLDPWRRHIKPLLFLPRKISWTEKPGGLSGSSKCSEIIYNQSLKEKKKKTGNSRWRDGYNYDFNTSYKLTERIPYRVYCK